MEPRTLYARSGNVSIAYQVVGDGPFDVVFIPGWLSHVELVWTVPSPAAARRRVATYARLILFDKRGTGMSDRVAEAPTLETRMDDVRAVMDAAGSERAALIGTEEGGPMSLLFAATYPERTAALVLWTAYARKAWAADYPWGSTDAEIRRELDDRLGIFGDREDGRRAIRHFGIPDGDELEALLDYLRRSASPGAVEALALMNRDIDVRRVLPAIRVPTLIVCPRDEERAAAEGRYLAQQIPTAELVELPTSAVYATGDVGLLLAEETERFLRGVWESGGWDEGEPDRVLATVLFTDLVGSTERAASLGDRAWRDLLARHHRVVREQLARYRGREVDTAGDGFFASFDGPARAIRCACAIVDGLGELELEVRAGLHTGECEVVDGKVAGISVYTGARVADRAEPGEVLVSSTVKDLVAGSGLEFEDRGVHELKGVPGDWHLYRVVPAEQP